MTCFNNKYPYTDFHELNADWLIERVDNAADKADAMDGRVTTLENDVENLQQTSIEHDAKINEHDDDINNIEGRLTQYDQNFLNINANFVSDQRRIGDLETYRTESQVKIGNLGYSIAPLFDASAAYTAGDYVMSPNLKLHKALVNIPAGTADINDLTQFTPTDIVDNMGGSGTAGVTKYLRFSTGGTPFDYDARITYSYLNNLIGTTASVDMPVNIILVEDDEVGTTWYYTLNEGRYQVSAGSPRGAFTFTCRKPVLDDNNVVTGYNVCTVTVDKNSATPTYDEVDEDLYIYSTSEKVVGTWTDNKPVYEKIITTPLPSTPNTTFLFAHNIADIDSIIEYKAFMIFPNGTVHTFNDIQLDSGGIYSPAVSFLGVDITNITIMCGIDRSTCSGRVFLRYTKTTD